jgi:hypothetical protein
MALGNHKLPSGLLKCDFGEVDKAMFQGVDGPCEIFFQSDFNEVAELSFK